MRAAPHPASPARRRGRGRASSRPSRSRRSRSGKGVGEAGPPHRASRRTRTGPEDRARRREKISLGSRRRGRRGIEEPPGRPPSPAAIPSNGSPFPGPFFPSHGCWTKPGRIHADAARPSGRPAPPVPRPRRSPGGLPAAAGPPSGSGVVLPPTRRHRLSLHTDRHRATGPDRAAKGAPRGFRTAVRTGPSLPAPGFTLTGPLSGNRPAMAPPARSAATKGPRLPRDQPP